MHTRAYREHTYTQVKWMFYDEEYQFAFIPRSITYTQVKVNELMQSSYTSISLYR